MIGVLADETQHAVVREFFELFKTPWEFYRNSARYDVLLCSDRRFIESSAAVVLVYGTNHETFDRSQGLLASGCHHVRFSYSGQSVPIYGRCIAFTNGRSCRLFEDDSSSARIAVEIDSGKQIIFRLGFDLFHEVFYLLTTGQPAENARIPTLDLHIDLIRKLLIRSSINVIEIPPVPAGHNFVACLTHDVDHARLRSHKFDHTIFGFLYRALVGSLVDFCRGRRSGAQLAVNWLAACSLPFVYLGIAKDFWNQLERYVEIERGVTSTFFVIPISGTSGKAAAGRASPKRASKYAAAEISEELQHLLAKGRELGVHGIDAWCDTEKACQERAEIERLTRSPAKGVRMHWLFFDENSAATLEKAGFSYDSTVGYNETVGYRAGTTQVFKPLRVTRLLELPLHLMDTSLFFPDYLDLSQDQALGIANSFVENATRLGGVLTINWHDRSIAPERLWDDVYIKLLGRLKDAGAWFATGSQSTDWFRKRRSAIIETVENGEDSVRVKVSVDGPAAGLPALRLRVHRPSQQENDSGFAEAIFDQSGEVHIAI